MEQSPTLPKLVTIARGLGQRRLAFVVQSEERGLLGTRLSAIAYYFVPLPAAEICAVSGTVGTHTCVSL